MGRGIAIHSEESSNECPIRTSNASTCGGSDDVFVLDDSDFFLLVLQKEEHVMVLEGRFSVCLADWIMFVRHEGCQGENEEEATKALRQIGKFDQQLENCWPFLGFFQARIQSHVALAMDETRTSIATFLSTYQPSDPSLALTLQDLNAEAFSASFVVGSLEADPQISFQIFHDQDWLPLVRFTHRRPSVGSSGRSFEGREMSSERRRIMRMAFKRMLTRGKSMCSLSCQMRKRSRHGFQ